MAQNVVYQTINFIFTIFLYPHLDMYSFMPFKFFQLHGRSFIAATFLAHVTGPAAAERSAAFNRVLQNLLELYLVHTTQRHLSAILQVVDVKII